MSDEAPRPPIPERPLLRGDRVWLRPLEAIQRDEWEAARPTSG